MIFQVYSADHEQLKRHTRVIHESSCEYTCANAICLRETALPILTTSTRAHVRESTGLPTVHVAPPLV